MFFQSFSLSISVQLFPSLISHLPSHHKNKPDVTNTTNPQPLPPPTPAPLPPSKPPPPSYPSTYEKTFLPINQRQPPPPPPKPQKTNKQSTIHLPKNPTPDPSTNPLRPATGILTKGSSTPIPFQSPSFQLHTVHHIFISPKTPSTAFLFFFSSMGFF